MIATGATPLRPPIPGIDLPGVHGMQTLEDGLAILGSLGAGAHRAVVVGAGYIGMEMAEAMCERGLQTKVVDLARQPMPTLDPDMGTLVAEAMTGMGITYRGGEPVRSLDAGAKGRVARVVTAAGAYDADVDVLGLGVRPNSDLAKAAGLPTGERDGILTDDRVRVEGHPGVWAAATASRSWTAPPVVARKSPSARTPTSTAG